MDSSFSGYSPDDLTRVCIYLRASKAQEICDPLNKAAAQADVTTRLRAAMWLAQWAHETMNFRFLEEIWGPTAAQAGYEGKASLGNTQPGDGSRFRGRGICQLTGRANYAAFSDWLGDPTIMSNPELVATPDYGYLAGAWYWRTRELNTPSDQGDLEKATRLINGGLNGIDHREELYDRACDVLGV